MNETFKVGYHDFSKLSFIPDAYLLHEIPDQETKISTLERNKDGNTIMTKTSKIWYTGQVYYGIKNMVTEGSTAMRWAAEFGKIISQYLTFFLQGFMLILTEVLKEKLIIFKYKNPMSAFFSITTLMKY